MAKFYGNIGFAETEETAPGVWMPSIREYPYYGELTKVTSRYQTANQTNDNLNISNQLSILADPFIRDNFYNIKYVYLYGAKWKVTNVDVQPPRLILSIGGVWNND